MRYRKPPAFVRNDLLTAQAMAQLQAHNGPALEEAFRREHRANGEHNSLLFARTLGTVLCAAGPTYTKQGFNGDASLETGHNPSVGKLILTLAAARYNTFGLVQAQNASDDGANLPHLTWARMFDDTRAEFYSSSWVGTLGSSADAAWTAEDGAFHAAAHGPSLDVGSLLDFGTLLQPRRHGLRTVRANPLIQASADLQVALDVGHTAGVHDVRELPKAWAHVQCDSGGAGFTIIDSEVSAEFDAGDFDTVDIDSTGVLNVTFTGALATDDYQVFVDVDYSRLNGDPEDYFICCAPQAERSTGDFFLYFYKQFFDGSDLEYWDRSHEVDFHIWVYDDH